MAGSVKMTDIARAAGVSPMTVSRAFRDEASVGKETRAKILRIADDLGYVFDARASNLRSKRTGFVALIVPSIDNANFADTVQAMSGELAEAGLQILLGHDRYSAAEEERLLENLLRRRPEAVVVMGGEHTRRTRRMLRSAAVPVVEIWDLPEAPIAHVVGFSNVACMDMLVGHLAERGARRIAFIGGDIDDNSRGALRRRGFVAAMEGRGLDPTRLMPVGGPATMARGAAATDALLEQYPDTEAIVGVSDLAAFGALTASQRRDLSVPGDIAIAGFGAFEIASVSLPTLTTIDPHSTEIGRHAGQLIADILREPDRAKAPIRIEIGPVLRLGGSTG